MKLQHLRTGILNTGDTELIKDYIHTFSDFIVIDKFNDPYHPLIPYEIGDEDGTMFLKGEITSYSDYKNVIDQLIDLKNVGTDG